MSNTPNFDAALDKILADLKPHTCVCEETGESFDITERDIEMLKLLRVPPPTKVWWAYVRQLRAFMAGVDLFRRIASDEQSVVSMYDPESPVPILKPETWHADSFDAMQYGLPADPNRPLFEIWSELSRTVPRPSIQQDAKSVNSEWSVYSLHFKNCYQCGASMDIEDSIYFDFGSGNKHCVDMTFSHRSEWCYECVSCRECSRALFSDGCEQCADITFCLGCKNCSECFGCTNLRNKKFCFLNEQLTKDEYRNRVQKIDLTDSRVVLEWKTKTQDGSWKNAFRRADTQHRSENAVGDDIEDSRNVFGIIVFKSERLYYGVGSGGAMKDSMYFSDVIGLERSYMVCRTFNGYENKMTIGCENCIDVEYSELLTACEHCFGCIGLKHKKFCIFNKQYAEEEYWPLVDAIKTAMLERGEYGEYFPYRVSPFAYNVSFSEIVFPLAPKEAAALGARWYAFPEDASAEALPAEEIPFLLADATDDILNKRFRSNGRVFFFVKPELEFHRTMKVALPRLHPTERRTARFRQAMPLRLEPRNCVRCGKQVMTRVPKSYPAPLYCQQCYEETAI